jgi:alanine racemase
VTRQTRAEIDLPALRHNLGVARASAPNARIMAVIKANGYGHGLLPVAKAVASADALAVTSLEEAAPLREAGYSQRIVLLEGLYDPGELTLAARLGLDLIVHSDWQVEVLERAHLERPVSCWLKVDSGMHRLGFPAERVASTYRRLHACASVAPQLRFITHLASADDRTSDYTRFQLSAFASACEGLPGERSIANSAGLLAWPETHADWVRPGVMLYGATPFADAAPEHPNLAPAMTLTSRLISIQHFKRGDRVGYAGTYVCPEDMPVGVVAIGYGDGYPRHAPSGTPVLVGGERAALVGRVSMDMLCVDLRGLKTVYIDAPVTLWGRGLPIEEIAQASGTISYELMCQVTGRVHFDYRD